MVFETNYEIYLAIIVLSIVAYFAIKSGMLKTSRVEEGIYENDGGELITLISPKYGAVAIEKIDTRFGILTYFVGSEEPVTDIIPGENTIPWDTYAQITGDVSRSFWIHAPEGEEYEKVLATFGLQDKANIVKMKAKLQALQSELRKTKEDQWKSLDKEVQKLGGIKKELGWNTPVNFKSGKNYGGSYDDY